MIEQQIWCPRCSHQVTGHLFQHGFTCPVCGVVRKTSIWGDPISTFGDTWHGADISGRALIVAMIAVMASPFVAFTVALILSVTHAHP